MLSWLQNIASGINCGGWVIIKSWLESLYFQVKIVTFWLIVIIFDQVVSVRPNKWYQEL